MSQSTSAASSASPSQSHPHAHHHHHHKKNNYNQRNGRGGGNNTGGRGNRHRHLTKLYKKVEDIPSSEEQKAATTTSSTTAATTAATAAATTAATTAATAATTTSSTTTAATATASSTTTTTTTTISTTTTTTTDDTTAATTTKININKNAVDSSQTLNQQRNEKIIYKSSRKNRGKRNQGKNISKEKSGHQHSGGGGGGVGGGGGDAIVAHHSQRVREELGSRKKNKLKVIVRNLPPTMTEQQFLSVIPSKFTQKIIKVIEEKENEQKAESVSVQGQDSINNNAENTDSDASNGKVAQASKEVFIFDPKMVDWFAYRQGIPSFKKHSVYSKSLAYIQFTKKDYLYQFKDEVHGMVLKDIIKQNSGENTVNTHSKGSGTDLMRCFVEYAPYQGVSNDKKGSNDPREGTIFEDAHYKKFLEELQKPKERMINADKQLELLEEEERKLMEENNGILPYQSTPLLDYLINKRKKKEQNSRRLRKQKKLKVVKVNANQ
jgi:hypothetical protein